MSPATGPAGPADLAAIAPDVAAVRAFLEPPHLELAAVSYTHLTLPTKRIV